MGRINSGAGVKLMWPMKEGEMGWEMHFLGVFFKVNKTKKDCFWDE